jgi:hypothetical protein
MEASKQKKIVFFSTLLVNIAILLWILYSHSSEFFWFNIFMFVYLFSLFYFLYKTLIFEKTSTFMITYCLPEDHTRHLVFIKSFIIDKNSSDDDIYLSFVNECKIIHEKNNFEKTEPLIVNIQKINTYYQLKMK